MDVPIADEAGLIGEGQAPGLAVEVGELTCGLLYQK